eukprot:m.255162 g.255162  ORF g.255162 m.255162 type:complete len:437 (+) comp19609_c0_seq1:77-1387(+)
MASLARTVVRTASVLRAGAPTAALRCKSLLQNNVNSCPVAIKKAYPCSIFSLRTLQTTSRCADDLTVNLPQLSESISEGEVGTIEIETGSWVNQDDVVMQIETDKTTVPIPAPEAGVVVEYFVEEGDTIGLNAPLFKMETGGEAPAESSSSSSTQASEPAPVKSAAPEAPKPAAAPPPPPPSKPAPPAPSAQQTGGESDSPASSPVGTTRVKMTRMRQVTASRLKESQNVAAFLTTFNEIDMSTIMAIRSKYKDEFLKKHDVKFGFMSVFCKAVANACKAEPAVNAFIDGKDIVYHDFVNISVAVAAPKGLVTPVIRNVENKTFKDVEADIAEMSTKAREGKLAVEDMDGGTITISNGGVFGSLMGTPIINPPQSAVLGMHGIFERPVAVDGEVVIRPMMYVALTYDHRLIDGREAVTFLRKVKEGVEDPNWLLLG